MGDVSWIYHNINWGVSIRKYPMVELEENVMINASFLPNAVLAEMVSNLEPNQVI
jgi:hypothetical protein